MKNGGKVLHLFWRIEQYLDLSRKRCPEIGKSKSDISQKQKLKTYNYAIPLLERKPENIVLHLGTNDAPYKTDTDILKDLIELKDFILENSPSCRKITLSSSPVRTGRENAKKNNEKLTNRLKKQGIPYLTHGSITHKHLYRSGVHLNTVGFSILAENFLTYICRN